MKKLVLGFTLVLLLAGGSVYLWGDNSQGDISVTIGRLDNERVTFPIREEIVPNMDKNILKKLVEKIETPKESPIETPSQPYFFIKPSKKIEEKLFKLPGIEKGKEVWVHFPGNDPIKGKIDSMSGFTWRCGEDFSQLQGQIILSKDFKGKTLSLGGIGFGDDWTGEYVIISFGKDTIKENKVQRGFDINQNGVSEKLIGEHKREEIKLKIVEENKIIFEISYGC